MTIVALPAGIQKVEWTPPDPNTFSVVSRWTAAQTIGDLGGVRDGWRAKVTVVPGDALLVRSWRAFFAQLRGPTNTFMLKALEAPQKVSNPPLTFSSRVTATQLQVAGLPVSQAQIYRAGDIIVFDYGANGTQACVLTADLASDGLGIGDAFVFPAPRRTPTAGSGIDLYWPSIEMRLAGPAPGWTALPGMYEPGTFDCLEVIR